MLKYISQIIVLVVAGYFIFSCQEEQVITNSNAKLSFTTDTISFDTVFTSIGSTTDWFKVKNENSGAVVISQIYLAGGEDSPFRLNINGVESINEENVEIKANDSIFVFVEVTIDPTGVNNPMVFNDSVVFRLNGNEQDVKLIAFGQDFHLFNGEVIESQNWQNDKPYLIYNSILVDEGQTLTIDAGCQVYFHYKSGLLVKGSLKVNGTVDEPVYFQGDRLEEIYENVPGQWGDWLELDDGSLYVLGGIHFLQGSQNNEIDYAVIKNAQKGIQCDSLGSNGNPMLVISNSRVENMTLNCIDARTSDVIAQNCIFANSGSYSVKLVFGGDYQFIHCTLANYYGLDTRSEPTLILTDSYEYEDIVYDFDLKSYFGNCIIYGNNEYELDIVKGGQKDFDCTFSSCLVKRNKEFTDVTFTDSYFNQDPLFTGINDYNYSIDSLSPARDIGNIDIARLLPVDLKNNSRLDDDGPDLGALEWMPTAKEE